MKSNIQAIFESVIALPQTERPAAVKRLCANDAAAQTEVNALLKSHDEAGAFLGSPTADLATADRITETPGQRIGPYKLLQLIGEGGFGSVFLAEQTEPVRRRVALKIIKLGMDTRQVIARFEAERQALALMDHPHIAKVLDAGATDSGRPYFVMEYVVGDSITAFAGAHALTIRQRLELFAQVCSAVQHAHTKGVIHRDIKPANVLVSMTDGKPFAKVIDFGIAKATAQPLTEKTLFTEHRQLIGTPEYMSPEQAQGSADIDTRTDVYALGVLLYELLTGATPFDAKRLRSAAWGEMQRIIREEEPPTPSMRVTAFSEPVAQARVRLGQPDASNDPQAPRNESQTSLPQVAPATNTTGHPAPTLARASGSDRAALSRQIKGELDWIVMKALDKDRSRRYESPSQLAADVTRHLAGEPVVAAPPSRAYRVRKFVRKHKGPVVATTAVAAALLMGIAGIGLGLYRAKQANAILQRHHDLSVASAEEIMLTFSTYLKLDDHFFSDDKSFDVREVRSSDGTLRGRIEAKVTKDATGKLRVIAHEYDAQGRRADNGLLIEELGKMTIAFFKAYERDIDELKAKLHAAELPR